MRQLAIIAIAAALGATPAHALVVLDGAPAAAPAATSPASPGFSPAPPAAAASFASLGQPGVGSPLPEPSTWITLIVGFALVGFAARWRRPQPWPAAR